MGEVSLVYCTAATREEAVTMARTVVEERLAACVNLWDGVTSIYRWQGAVQQEQEAVLILKTSRELVARLTARIRELHRYECPAILAWTPTAGNAEYLDWIRSEVSSG